MLALMGRSLAFLLVALVVVTQPAAAQESAQATLNVPATAPAGSTVEVSWTGPNAERDFISIDPAGAPERSYGKYVYASKGSPASLSAPDEPGDYEVRYHVADGYAVIGRAPLTVTDVSARLESAETAPVGSEIEIRWEGPAHERDFISIDPVGSPDRHYGVYGYASKGSPLKLRAPGQAGDYAVRYHMANTYRVIGETPLKVTDLEVTLDAPESVTAGSEIAVGWNGPGNPRDFISIDPPGAPDRTYGNYAYPAHGNPVTVRVPDEAGDYVLRYHLEQDYRVLGERPLEVANAVASVEPPAEAETRSIIEVRWQGPNNKGDFITIVERGAPERYYGLNNGYPVRGNPVRIEAPEKPGEYDVRYLTGQKYLSLASAPLTIVPGKAPGRLRVVGAASEEAAAAPGAVELILDASGSMLQRIDGVPRIQIARDALVELTQNVLGAGTPFALRVFGHREADSCRTDLEIALAPLKPAEAVARIRSIEAKNLAKTPIAASLLAVREDLAGAKGPAVVVLVTDGEETCEGDPKAAITTLREAGIDARINIVGFAIDEVVLKETFEEWAAVGEGSYFDAGDAAELNAAMRASLRVPFQVVQDGAVVASGVVNGDAIELPPGDYELRVLSDPPRVAGQVSVESGGEHELDIGGS